MADAVRPSVVSSIDVHASKPGAVVVPFATMMELCGESPSGGPPTVSAQKPVESRQNTMPFCHIWSTRVATQPAAAAAVPGGILKSTATLTSCHSRMPMSVIGPFEP